MASRRVSPDPRDRGQATVEFVLTLPLVFFSILLVVQLAVVLTERAHIENVTWNAARSASVAASPDAAARDVVDRLVGDGTKVIVDDDGRFVTVRVQRNIPTDVPLVGRFLPDVTVGSQLTLLREPPLG
jgi:Flp pilus assembly protein TadG